MKQLAQTQDNNSTLCNVLSALFVFAVSFGVYLTTVAPSVAFWDCGEYIAASHSLGIPHPPGNPLFVLMMRVSSMFFAFFEDVGYRMNFAVALSSALTTMVLYLVIVDAAKLFVGAPDTIQKKITLSVGGIVGGLFAAFGYTFWFSAVEMSVYNLSMLNIAICTLLMLKWARSARADRDKLLILVAFLGFLGIGLHMYTMIIFPPAFLFMVMWDEKKRRDWRLWGTGIAMAAIIYSLSTFLWLGPLTLLITLIMSLSSENHKAEWRLCFFFALFAIVGYSVHAFIPIRSALEPMINENHPSTWQAFVGFLERKQYGSESMITRMFWRRGLLENQFGIEEHMGYGGFHITQFFRFALEDTGQSMFRHGFGKGISQLLLYLVPTAFMIFGWVYYYKKNRAAAVFLVSLTLLTTIGMVFYMNFADGNRPERFDYERWISAGKPGNMPTVHREVRVRDYFFTAGFMYFGMWIGLAASCFLHRLFSSKENAMRTVAAPICAVMLVISPLLPAAANHKLSTRAGDWVAYGYAYNLLQSCEPNGIIFTNGDNDTFPLWAMQEAYGIRKDVRIVNLSLVNTDWYIKQLKKLEPRVPISYTEEDINNLLPRYNPFPEPRRHTLRNAGLTFTFPGIKQHSILRVQDLMVLHIVDANGVLDTVKEISTDAKGISDTTIKVTSVWQKPIYFAITVSEDNLMGLTPFLRTEGLVYRLMQEPVTADNHYNLDRTLALTDTTFSLRGIGQARFNDTSRRTLTNYLQVAFDLRRPMEARRNELDLLRTLAEEERATSPAGAAADGNNAAAGPARQRFAQAEQKYSENTAAMLRFLDHCVELMPWDWRPNAIRHEFLLDNGMFDEAVAAMEQALTEDPENLEQYQLMLNQAQQMRAAKGGE